MMKVKNRGSEDGELAHDIIEATIAQPHNEIYEALIAALDLDN